MRRLLSLAAAVGLCSCTQGPPAPVVVAQPAAPPPPAARPGDLPPGVVRHLGATRRVPQMATPVPPTYTRFVAPPAGGGSPEPARDLADPPSWAPTREVDIPAVSADGRRAVAGNEPHATVWEVATGKVVRQVAVPKGFTAVRGGAQCAALSADGRVLARSYYGPNNSGKVVVRDVDTDAVIGDHAVPSFTALALTPDGTGLAVWSGVNTPPPAGAAVDPRTTVRVLDARTGKERFQAPATPAEGSVSAVAFSPDGKVMAVGTAGGPVDLWDVAAGARTHVLVGVTGQGARLGFSPDGTAVAAVAVSGVVQRWAVADGRLLGTAPPPPGLDRDFPRGVGLRSADDAVVWADGPSLVAWEVPSGKVLASGSGGHAGILLDVRFGKDGEVVTAGADGRVIRWDGATGARVEQVTPKAPAGPPAAGPALRARVFPAGGRFALADEFRAVVFDLGTGEEAAAIPSGGNRGEGQPKQFLSRDGGRVVTVYTPGKAAKGAKAAARGASWAVWEAGGRLAGRSDAAEGAENPVAVDVSPSGKRLVTLAQPVPRFDRVPIVLTGWEVKSGRRLGTAQHPGMAGGLAVAAVSETAALVAGGDGGVGVLDFETGQFGEVLAGAGPTILPRAPMLAVAPGSTRVAIGGPSASLGADAVRVFSWPRGEPLATLRGHRARPCAAGFSADGSRLAVGMEDGTVLVWDLAAAPK